MGIFKSLIKTLIKNTSTNNQLSKRTLITTPFPIPPLFPSPSLNPSLSLSKSSLLSPKWAPPFTCPLFLSSPPYQLSQFSTPLYLQGEDLILLKKVKAFEGFTTTTTTKNRNNFPVQLAELKLTNKRKEVRDDEDESVGGGVESFVNLPNLVSFGRLISGPFLGWLIVNEWYSSAFLGLAISGASDWLDGYLARKMHINSVVGSYLDPLADKVLIGCVALAMVHNDLLHPGLVGLVVLRDVALVGGAVYQRASSLGWEWKNWSDFFNLDGTNPQKVEPLFISKVNTVFQLALIAAALLQPEFGTENTETYITYLSWLVASTTVASTAAYGAQYMKKKAISTIKNH